MRSSAIPSKRPGRRPSGSGTTRRRASWSALPTLGKPMELLGLSQGPGINIIIGGPSHDALLEPIYANGKIIVQAGEFGHYLGELMIEFDGPQVKLVHQRLYPVDRRTRPDWSLLPTLRMLRLGIVADPRFGPVY